MASKKTIKEFICYGVAGVTTTLVNIAVYHGLLLLHMEYQWANLIALISSKLYGYFANKLFVFHSHCKSKKELGQEIARFVFSRGFTGLVDYFGLIFAVEVLRIDKVISKYVIQVIVIALNYVMGKFVVFRKENSDSKFC